MVLQQLEPGKSADGLGDNHVDVTSHALVDHSIEFITLFCVGAGDTVVCKYARQLPIPDSFECTRCSVTCALVACFLFFESVLTRQ